MSDKKREYKSRNSSEARPIKKEDKPKQENLGVDSVPCRDC